LHSQAISRLRDPRVYICLSWPFGSFFFCFWKRVIYPRSTRRTLSCIYASNICKPPLLVCPKYHHLSKTSTNSNGNDDRAIAVPVPSNRNSSHDIQLPSCPHRDLELEKVNPFHTSHAYDRSRRRTRTMVRRSPPNSTSNKMSHTNRPLQRANNANNIHINEQPWDPRLDPIRMPKDTY
jgi:hypothetical protein